MRLCYVADASSVHSRNLISFFAASGKHDVLVLSTTGKVREGAIPGARIVAVQRGRQAAPEDDRNRGSATWSLMPDIISESVASVFPMLHKVYTGVQCLRSLAHVERQLPMAQKSVAEFRPDVVHALRLQTEGFLAARLAWRPLVLSTWGNDLVYWAKRSRGYWRSTKATLLLVDGLVADNVRDLYLAELYGYSADKPRLVMPATGGIPADELAALSSIDRDSARRKFGFGAADVVILSVRGFYRAYTNTPGLIAAAPRILAAVPEAVFVLDGKGRMGTPAQRYLQRRARALGVASPFRFTSLDRPELFEMMRAADVMVSVVLYDGLPISLLEGMAAGLIPVMSNQSPLLEYIKPGVNGFVANPEDPVDIANQVIAATRALENRATIRSRNAVLLATKADRQRNLQKLDALYEQVARPRRGSARDANGGPEPDTVVSPELATVASRASRGVRR